MLEYDDDDDDNPSNNSLTATVTWKPRWENTKIPYYPCLTSDANIYLMNHLPVETLPDETST